MTKVQDPYIIPMCPEHPQNRLHIIDNPGNENSEYSINLGWTNAYKDSVWEKPFYNGFLHLFHIPINVCASSDSPTTWDCMVFETMSDYQKIFSVNYTEKSMHVAELTGYQITKGPHGKVNKILMYGEQLAVPNTFNGPYWDIVSYSKYENRGFFGSNKDACNYAVNLLAIDKAKIDMEMLKVQLQLI